MPEPRAAERTIPWALRYHYHCSACGWTAPQADFEQEPASCPRCGANPDGSDPWPQGTNKNPAHGWVCFHCGETFIMPAAAALHFGADPEAEPGCIIHVESSGLLNALRELEGQLARYRDEDTDKDRAYHALVAEHATALRREEERGYERGMHDERARALRIITRIKAGIRNGGARNACDHIAADLSELRDG